MTLPPISEAASVTLDGWIYAMIDHGRPVTMLCLLLFGVACGSSTDVVQEEPPIFSEDFEGGLGQWVGRVTGHHALIVPDPLDAGNAVVTFSETVAAGDLFSIPISVEEGVAYELEFDYLGLPQEGSLPDNLGGFLGVSDGLPGAEVWLFGPAANQAAHLEDLIEDGHWHSYSTTFHPSSMFELSAGTIRILLEDGEGEGSIPGDAYFDDIRLYRAPTG